MVLLTFGLCYDAIFTAVIFLTKHRLLMVAQWLGHRISDQGVPGSTQAGVHFVVALSKSHLPCLVLVEPRKRWMDDRLGQTVTRLEITLCLIC